LDACTIIARNYLAQARVLAESYLEHHPGSRFFTLVIDEPGPPGREPFEALGPRDIGLEPREFHRMAGIYDVMELATAVKPWLLRRLLEDASEVVYLDPDIQIFGSLDPVSKLARKHSIVLTPHSAERRPHDREQPGETTFLLSGIYNLGFIALAPGRDGFLDWWSERVARDCIVAPERGHFVDQRWADLVPALFDHYVLRDPAYNVAWWNLPGRTLRWTGKRYTANGKALRFFHFSGFDPREPHILSKHQGPVPHILLSEHPDLARICAEYTALLHSAGFAEVSSLPYRYDTTSGGVPVDRRMRRLYRDALLAAEEDGEPEPANPFEEEKAFLAWLREPPDTRGAAGKIGRYLQAVYRDRPDVQAAFPDLRWLNGDRFLSWVLAHGQDEESIPLELLPEPPVPARRSTAPASELLDGVNVAGYFRAEVGVGEAARHVISGIERAGIPFASVNYEQTPSRQDHAFGHRDSPTRYDVNLICVNADRLPEFAYDMGPEFFEGRYSIGLWWWEIGEFPERFHEAFDIVDEIWVGSDFVAEAVSRATSKPVRTLPLGVTAPAVKQIPRSALGLPEGFQFLFSFDFYSVFERKNPLGLIEAFRQAFEPGEGPTLVIKSINGDERLVDLERLRAAADRPDIVVVDRYVSSDEKNALMAGCDCYVSLHRSEGFGLTIAEAMAYGKPVIATAYSGNLMFMNEANSYLVPYRPTVVPDGCDPYPEGVAWAEPDVSTAAQLMRHVFENQGEARELGLRAEEDMRVRHSPKQTADFVASRLKEVRLHRNKVLSSTPNPETASDSAGQAISRAAAYLERGPTVPWNAPSRLGPVGRSLRLLVRRVLRPYTIRQGEFEAAVVEAVAAQERTLDALRDIIRSAGEDRDAAPELAAAVEQRLAATQRRQLERLRSVESLIETFNESFGAQLAAQAGGTRQFDLDVANHLARIDSQLASVLTRTGLLSELHEPEPVDADTKADVSTFGERYSPPEQPWTHEYVELHRRLVSEALGDDGFLRLFTAQQPLPAGYGIGFDERVVEFPWIVAQEPSGRMLDAGSALNHAHVLERIRPLVQTLDIVTLAPEEVAFPHKEVSYLYADLRDLPYRDEHFTTVVSLSTLEHVGMDNTMYGVDAPRADNPEREMGQAVAELIRVLAPGGVFLVTVPYGRREDHGWLRQFDRADVERLIAAVPAREVTCSVYRYSQEGWQLSDLEEAAGAQYRDYLRDPHPVPDLAAAARAVACIRFDF
jgi:glycosyltransferase involved in cell wall biosynthesis/SAM-dependent methyltransferase